MSDSLTDIKDSFIKELVLAHAGKPSSLPFIVHEMPEFSLVSEGEVFQVIIVGGTFALSAHVKKENGKCLVVSTKTAMLSTLVDKEDFFLFIEQNLMQDVQVLALNIAFPLEPIFENGRLDGKLIRGTKEHTLRGLVGEKIGKTIELLVLQKTGRKITVSVANDTVCLLLSGLEKASFEKLGAGIVGSGMNFAFYLNKTTLVNLESANFNKFQLSKEVKEIDAVSENPGGYLYEKEVAGIYLYKHFNSMLRENHINFPPVAHTKELDEIAKGKLGQVSNLASDLLQRSAKLIACQVAAIMEYRKTDMIFVMEGSLFWFGLDYKINVEKTVKELTNYKAEFMAVKDSGIIGAAHLVM